MVYEAGKMLSWEMLERRSHGDSLPPHRIVQTPRDAASSPGSDAG